MERALSGYVERQTRVRRDPPSRAIRGTVKAALAGEVTGLYLPPGRPLGQQGER